MESCLFDILGRVEQPSRYLGTEINSVVKDPGKVDLSMALVFPDSYEIGISHFGIQILYDILNNRENIAAERVYTPEPDLLEELNKDGLKIFSHENKRVLKDFDIVGFSLLYELNYTNVLYILENSDIPFFSKDRDLSYPLVIGGGPSVFNPEPVADFFDALVIGDGEESIVQISEVFIKWKKENKKDKNELLKILSEIEGVYVPSFFDISYDEKGIQKTSPKFEHYNKVKKALVSDLDFKPFPEKPIIPYSRPIHDRLRLEIARGCSRGCRFCQAGIIYRPVRERSLENLLSITEKSIKSTGFEDLSLLSLSTGDYGCLHELMKNLMERYKDDKLSVSLPSIRAGKLDAELMELIKKVRKTGFTIAPEAGTQRLRDVINKGITEEDILKTVESAFSLGWKVIKLYFMIGLPTETDEDIKGIVDLVKKLLEMKKTYGRKAEINVSVSTFVPKSHSPFQWSQQISLEESDRKIFWLKDNLKLKGVNFKWGKPTVSFLEGIFSRGDRKLSELIVEAYKNGCIFDGWTERFNKKGWDEAIEKCGVDPDFYITRQRDFGESLPWDHIDSRVTKKFLKKEFDNAIAEVLTEDCRDGKCSGCGICDFKEIKPRVFSEFIIPPYNKSEELSDNYKNVKITYSKKDAGKFFGHLEMVTIFQRALKRCRIPVKFTQGFHPKPKMSFGNPLPIGVESEVEYFKIPVHGSFDIKSILDSLNKELPLGMNVEETEIFDKNREKSLKSVIYEITGFGDSIDLNKISLFNESEKFIVFKTNKKGVQKELDLKKSVLSAEMKDNVIFLDISAEQGVSVRPHLFLNEVMNLDEGFINTLRFVKKRNIYS